MSRNIQVYPCIFQFVYLIINYFLQVKRKAAEVQEMWDNVIPEVREAYDKAYVMSWTNPPVTRGWNSNSDVMKPVTLAIEDALRSPYPRARYMVPGHGAILSFIDDHAVWT